MSTDGIPSGVAPQTTEAAGSIWIDSHGKEPVYFSAEDFEVFALTQGQSLRAAQVHRKEEEARREVRSEVGRLIGDLRSWCADHPVGTCLVAPNMDETVIVIVAADEDEHGLLHDAMAELDLRNFQLNRLRLSWMLLRRSEAAGWTSFVRPEAARLVYRAHA